MTARNSKSSSTRVPARLRGLEEIAFWSETASGLQPLSFEQYMSTWLLGSASLQQIFKKCRELAGGHSYMQWVCGLKRTFFNAGITVSGDSSIQSQVKRVAGDAWSEYLACDNAIAIWNTNLGLPTPVVTIFDCDQVEYSNALGIEKLKVWLPQSRLTVAQQRIYGPRISDAIMNGRALTLEERHGEYFKVLTRAKLGRGLAMPRMKVAFLDLAIYDILRQGDHNGAWARKNLMRHSKKGHESKYGAAAGSPAYFFTKAFGEKLKKRFAGMNGFSEFVSNFDLTLDYVYLNPEYFSKETLETTIERLDRWAGPAGSLLQRGAEGRANPHLMHIFQEQGNEERAAMAEFLEGIYNHESFGLKDPVKVTFSETVWLNSEQLQKWIQYAQGAGLMSGQTARSLLGLDSEKESRLIKASHEDALAFTPPFEAKQGLLRNEGGRPEAGKEKKE